MHGPGSGPAHDHGEEADARSSLRVGPTPPQLSLAQLWSRALGAGAIYWAAGRLALLMAIPPGYATAVWPAAGLALACCLKWGVRVTPGIVLGSFCVNVATSFDDHSAASVARSLTIALLIGMGAGAQAALGSLGIRRYVGSPTPLESVRDVTRFALIAGPLACTVAPSVGVTTLCVSGVVPWQNFAFSWATWWVGDTIGALIVAPLALILTSGSSHMRHERRLIVSLPLLLGFGLVTLLFLRASAWESQRLRVDFERRAAGLAGTLETSLTEYEEVVGSLSSLFDVVPEISLASFRQFTQRPLAKYPAIQALGWSRVVTQAERARFEAEARARDPSFEIKVLDEHQQLRAAGARPEYVIICYLEPYSANQVAVGFDLSSEPRRKQAMDSALATRSVAASARVNLVQTYVGDSGVLLFSPVFSPEQAVTGYTFAAFRMMDVTKEALRGLEHSGIGLRILDRDAIEPLRVLYDELAGAKLRSREDMTHRWTREIVFGERHWTIEVIARPQYMIAQRSWQAWMVLAGGLFFVSMLGVVMLIATGRTSISQEIAARFGALVESSAQIVWAANAAGEMVEDSPSWRAFTGRTLAQWRGRGWLAALHPDDRKAIEQLWKNALRTQTAVQTEYRIQHVSGSWRWTAARAIPLFDEVGAVRGWVGMNTDITEQKLLAEQFRLAIAASPTGMLMVDREGTIKLANDQVEKLLGYARGELVDKALETLVPERVRRQHEDLRGGFFAAPRVRRMAPGSKLSARCKDGTEIAVEITLTPLHTPDGDFVLGSVLDIRERERAERERERLLEQLQTLNSELEERVRSRTRQLSAALREREVMLQEIHHRVKNNLQVIASLINMQMRRLSEEASKDALEECKSRIHAIALIHETLYRAQDYARVQFSEYAAVLTRTVLQSAGLVPSDIALELSVEDVALPVDRAIPCGLILNELVTNALKHAFPNRRPGSIRVELARVSVDKVRLAVRDDGVGLPKDFDIHQSSSVGLQLVTTLCEQLDGALEVTSQAGTSFVLTMPLSG